MENLCIDHNWDIKNWGMNRRNRAPALPSLNEPIFMIQLGSIKVRQYKASTNTDLSCHANLHFKEGQRDVDWQALGNCAVVHQFDPKGHRLGDGQEHGTRPNAGNNDLNFKPKWTQWLTDHWKPFGSRLRGAQPGFSLLHTVFNQCDLSLHACVVNPVAFERICVKFVCFIRLNVRQFLVWNRLTENINWPRWTFHQKALINDELLYLDLWRTIIRIKPTLYQKYIIPQVRVFVDSVFEQSGTQSKTFFKTASHDPWLWFTLRDGLS